MKSLFNSLRAAWSYAWPRLRSVFGTAAKLAARRAELARLDAVTFSQLYLASGKAVAVAKTLPADLEALRKKVASLQDSLSSRGERS